MNEETTKSVAYRANTSPNNGGIGLGEVKRESEFDREGQRLSMNLEQLLKMVSILEGRIEGILRPQELKDGGGLGTPECSTELGRFIKERSSQVEYANNRIADIISRVEI